MRGMRLPLTLVTAAMLAAAGLSAQTRSEARKILSIDHKVTVTSIVPAIAGQTAQIYVRERVAEGMTRPAADRALAALEDWTCATI